MKSSLKILNFLNEILSFIFYFRFDKVSVINALSIFISDDNIKDSIATIISKTDYIITSLISSEYLEIEDNYVIIDKDSNDIREAAALANNIACRLALLKVDSKSSLKISEEESFDSIKSTIKHNYYMFRRNHYILTILLQKAYNTLKK